ncbi:MAG TPA: helix-turn-helix domain-containing protein [Reyranella sp.]|nr:helix-turn-helix domain-containing protein [Reyranella sp.]
MATPTPEKTTAAHPAKAPHEGGAACPMDYILRMLMGPWTTYIVYNLRTYGPQRFGELKRRVAGISAKMLTERLRTLEGAGLIKRDYEATIPPKVTYSLTPRGHELDEVLEKLGEVAIRWQAEDRAGNKKAELKAA